MEKAIGRTVETGRARMEGDFFPGRHSHEVPAVAPRREYLYKSEIRWAWVVLAVTLAICGMVTWESTSDLQRLIHEGQPAAILGQAVFMIVVGFLIYGNLVYQLTRLGYLARRADHRPVATDELEAVFGRDAASLSILVPSYKEEPGVVRRTLLSAALQDYPIRRVVLLIDDPADPRTETDAHALRTMEALPATLQAAFDEAAAFFARRHDAYLLARSGGRPDLAAEGPALARLYDEAAAALTRTADGLSRGDPGDRLLLDTVIDPLVVRHRERAAELRALARSGALTVERADREYARLASLFRVAFSSFQRKRYANLSHEPNKAMNLNAYIELMGQPLRETRRADGVHLERCPDAEATIRFPDAEFLITLDADSILLPDYALRLIHHAEQPGNERLAVLQTPYSSIPAAPGSLEHIAGATTDIQYIIHQGFTANGATYWVGANALLRRRALEDIAENDVERGYPIRRYIQDRTVIEDTESSIDLVARGWQLYNYPERLAYSATPPDFGSLLIQRRRWANGGLIILPKLLRHMASAPLSRTTWTEGFFRLHYLVSIAAVNIGLLILFAFPFEEGLKSVWLPLSAAPYFLLYARDLTRIGYRASDLLRIYALNLLLLPVNIGGVLKSIEQAVTRRKIPFGRTPKVDGRTAAPALYVAAEFGMLAWWSVAGVGDLFAGLYAHAAFALVNAAFLWYAVARYLGFGEGWQDLRTDVGARLPGRPVPVLKAG